MGVLYWETWFVSATSVVVTVLLTQWFITWRRKGVSLRQFCYAALISASAYPILYLAHAFFRGAKGKGWMADRLPY